MGLDGADLWAAVRFPVALASIVALAIALPGAVHAATLTEHAPGEHRGPELRLRPAAHGYDSHRQPARRQLGCGTRRGGRPAVVAILNRRSPCRKRRTAEADRSAWKSGCACVARSPRVPAAISAGSTSMSTRFRWARAGICGACTGAAAMVCRGVGTPAGVTSSGSNPNASAKDVYQFGGRLMDEYGLSGLPIRRYGGPN
jgi:hypothetical protein